MKPNFSALFRQSRYSRVENIEGSSESGCNQHERFSAAVIAFGFHYDPHFRKHFLDKICDFRGESDFAIEIEPKRCSDLLIKNGKILFVVEIKIGATLQNHQNPERKEFWEKSDDDREKEGYGFLWLHDPEFREYEKIHFITLERQSSWRHPNQLHSRLNCFSKEWRNLKRKDESQIEKAIYDFLGSRGVNTFISRTMSMKIDPNEAAGGVHVYNILKATAEEIPTPLDLEVSSSDKEDPYFGVRLKTKDFPEAAQLIKADEKGYLGWFGYHSFSEIPFEPCVYFYCGSDGAVQFLKKSSMKIISNGSRNLEVTMCVLLLKLSARTVI